MKFLLCALSYSLINGLRLAAPDAAVASNSVLINSSNKKPAATDEAVLDSKVKPLMTASNSNSKNNSLAAPDAAAASKSVLINSSNQSQHPFCKTNLDCKESETCVCTPGLRGCSCHAGLQKLQYPQCRQHSDCKSNESCVQDLTTGSLANTLSVNTKHVCMLTQDAMKPFN
jgi:hypothetical protein